MDRAPTTTRLLLRFVSVAALAVVAMLATFAGAAKAGDFEAPALVGFDPEETNIPYLAWRGEKVRLVKCQTPDRLGLGGIDGAANITGATTVVEDWSGDPHQRPQFESTGGFATTLASFQNTTVFEGEGEMAGRICFASTLVSLKAGVALVKMSASGTNATGQPVMLMQHQFTVAWMNISSVNVEDIGSASLFAATPPPAVCDVTITGQCVNIALPATPATTAAAGNQIQVIVQGTIPLMGNFSEWGLGPQLTMPTDWARWAQVWARTMIQGANMDPCLWDIHDEFTGVPGGGAAPVAGDNHNSFDTNGRACNIGPSAPGTDEVDNQSASEIGPFSRFVHYFAQEIPTGVQPPGTTMAPVTDWTIGPFDPKRRDSSYIPDGWLNEGDAPMPALRVDAGFPGTGVGMLVPIDKHAVYTGNQNHPLWAPYYAAFLPATAAQRPGPPDIANPGAGLGTTASGIDGPAKGNNFEGFLNNAGQGGLYHYWDFTFAIARTGAPIINPITNTPCPPFSPGVPATGPSGYHVASVYTDEHGEARFGFAPGVGFNPVAGQIEFNANGGCDLLNNQLGTATIAAIARYPYQPVTDPDKPGDETVTKTVVGRFAKTITCVPKGGGLANQVAFICTATAIGVNNQPFVGETVCFISNAEAIMPLGPVAPAPAGLTGAAVVCVFTNNAGQASVEIFGKGNLNLIAYFVDEQLLRFIQLSPPTTVPVPGGSATGTAQTSTTAPTQAQIVSLGGLTTPAQPQTTTTKPAKVNRTKLVSSRFVVKKGVRSLVVRVNSPAKTAKVKVVMRSNGKTVATAVRTVRTNRAATVPNLRIAKKVNRVTVSVLR